MFQFDISQTLTPFLDRDSNKYKTQTKIKANQSKEDPIAFGLSPLTIMHIGRTKDDSKNQEIIRKINNKKKKTRRRRMFCFAVVYVVICFFSFFCIFSVKVAVNLVFFLLFSFFLSLPLSLSREDVCCFVVVALICLFVVVVVVDVIATRLV